MWLSSAEDPANVGDDEFLEEAALMTVGALAALSN